MEFLSPKTLAPSQVEELEKKPTGLVKLWRWGGFLQLSTPHRLLFPYLR